MFYKCLLSVSELPSKSNIGFMVSTDKEMNGSETFSLPWKHEMFTYSSGQTDNRNTPEIHTCFWFFVLAKWFLLLYSEGFFRAMQFLLFPAQERTHFCKHTERNRDTQELLLSWVQSSYRLETRSACLVPWFVFLCLLHVLKQGQNVRWREHVNDWLLPLRIKILTP